MAKYSVTFACGHAEERQLVGKETQRQAYIAWAGKSGRCSACGKADKMAAIEAVEAEHDLPELTGSEKQVTWARSIRSGLISGVAAYFETIRPTAERSGKIEQFEEHSAALMQQIGGETTARWWIDAKDRSTKELVQAAHKAITK